MKRTLFILMLLISMCVGDMAHAQMQWREVQHKVQSKSLVDPAQTDGVEIFGKDGVITIRTQRRVTVRVFTSVNLCRNPH